MKRLKKLKKSIKRNKCLEKEIEKRITRSKCLEKEIEKIEPEIKPIEPIQQKEEDNFEINIKGYLSYDKILMLSVDCMKKICLQAGLDINKKKKNELISMMMTHNFDLRLKL